MKLTEENLDTIRKMVSDYNKMVNNANYILYDKRMISVKVFDWDKGRDISGHNELREEVRLMVQSSMRSLILAAIDNAHARLVVKLEKYGLSPDNFKLEKLEINS